MFSVHDTDGDGFSDYGDDFPEDASAYLDNDSDGIEDSIDELFSFPELNG